MKNKYVLLFILIALWQTGFSQEKTDTAALIKEFKKVIAFSEQPYLFYTTVTRLHAEPALDEIDSTSINGTYYKNESDLYYKNGAEETFLQDSLLVEVNHQRKTIWVSRVDMASKKNFQAVTMGNKQLQQLLRKNYAIQKTVTDNQLSSLSFETKQVAGRSAVIKNRTELIYAEKDYVPRQVNITMSMQQPANDELMAQIKNQGIDERKLVKVINGQTCLVSMQTMNTAFANIETTKQKAMQMPVWQSVLDFNAGEQTYTAKGAYAEYEVTKTF